MLWWADVIWNEWPNAFFSTSNTAQKKINDPIKHVSGTISLCIRYAKIEPLLISMWFYYFRAQKNKFCLYIANLIKCLPVVQPRSVWKSVFFIIYNKRMENLLFYRMINRRGKCTIWYRKYAAHVITYEKSIFILSCFSRL